MYALYMLFLTFKIRQAVTINFEKRKKVYSLAKKYGVMILEDNPYGELRYFGENVPAIKSLDTDGIVMYAVHFQR